MPRLETAESLGPLPSARSGRPIARIDTTAIGEAVARFGATVADVGTTLAARQEVIDESNVQARLSEFRFNEDKLYAETVRNMQPGGAAGFSENYLKGYRERAAQFIGGVPDRLRPEYSQELFKTEQGIWSSASDFEWKEQARAAVDGLDTSIQQTLLPRARLAAGLPQGDPAKDRIYSEVEADGLRQIDQNPALTPIQKEAAKQSFRASLQSAFATSLPAEERRFIDPAAIDAPAEYAPLFAQAGQKYGIPPGLLASQARQESGFNPSAKSPAGATGISQFMPGTAERFGIDPTDPVQSVDAQGQYMRFLLDRYDGNVEYALAGYNWGEGNVDDWIAEGADPSKLPKETRNYIKAITGGQPANWSERLDALSYDDKIAIGADAETELTRRRTAETQQATEQYQNNYNSLLNAIEDGSAGLNDIATAYNDGKGWLTDYDDRVKAINAVEARDKEATTLASVTDRLASNDPFNPFNTDDREAVDLFYEKGIAQGGATLLQGDAEAIGRLRTLVDRTGYIPAMAKERLQMGMWSPDAETRDNAFAVADNLYRENRQAFMRAFSEGDVKRLQEYQNLALLSPEARAERLNPEGDPQREKFRSELEDKGREIAEKIDTGTILNAFDTSWLPGGEPGAPLDGIASQALRADFERLYADRYAALGNETAAQTAALDLLKRKWSPSNVGSASYLMPYAPEQFFKPIDSSHDWMSTQLSAFVSTEFPGAQSWSVVSMPFTEGAIGVGTTPSWAIGLIDRDGIYRTLLPPEGAKDGWPFDYDAAHTDRIGAFQQSREDTAEASELIESASEAQPGMDRPSAIMERFRERMGVSGSKTDRAVFTPAAVEKMTERYRKQLIEGGAQDGPSLDPIVDAYRKSLMGAR